MNIFDELGKIYNEIDIKYASIEVQARLRGHHKKEAEYLRKRYLNDQAYFLFMFTRLEGRVRDISNNLIGNKIATRTNWKTKRIWEIIPKGKSQYVLNFKDRVALLTPKGQTNYGKIIDYYNQRNNIGHGGTSTNIGRGATSSTVIFIPTVIADMKRLYKDLKG